MFKEGEMALYYCVATRNSTWTRGLAAMLKIMSSKKVLDSFQRFVLGGLVGCMKTTPRITCEVLLEVPPLNLWVRAAAFETLCHIKENCWIGNLAECARASLVKGVENHPVVICSDSQAALMTLYGFHITSKDVLKCRELLDQLAVNNLVYLFLVPGRSNILGNEKADRLENKGSEGVRATYCRSFYFK